MDLIQDIISRAKANPQHIVFPEGTEERTLKAADRLLAEGVVRLTLIGDPSAIRSHAQELGLHNIDKANLLDPKNHEKKQAYIDLLLDLRRKKGLTEEQAAVLVEDPLYLGCLMIKAGDADGELAGAINATGDVLRPALQIVKTTPGISCVSGIFMMFAAVFVVISGTVLLLGRESKQQTLEALEQTLGATEPSALRRE